MATSGATNGLHTIAHLLFSPGDIAFVENPTYFLANTMFKDDAGLVVKGGGFSGLDSRERERERGDSTAERERENF